MKQSLFFGTFFFLFVNIVLSQSIYEIKYEFPSNTTSPRYTAFLVRYNDGTGFMRVRYFNRVKMTNLVVHMSFDEIYAKSDNSSDRYDELEFAGKDPRMIMGEDNYNPDHIWFKKSASNKYFEPWGVTSPNSDHTFDQGNITSIKLLNSSDLTKEYVNLFFSTTDPFYVSLFKNDAPAQASTTNFYVINVANTQDALIARSCEVDLRRIKSEFTDISDFLGYKLVYKEITGSNFSKIAVQNAIANINPSANDIVIFCYSGHGFRYNNDERDYPQLDLRRTRFDNINDNTLNIADIYNEITSKNARLNIVLSDCCNSDIGLDRSIGMNFAQTQRSSMEWSRSNCKALFANTKASIIVSAAKKGEVAYCNSDIGGYLIYSFFLSLEKKFTKGYFGTLSWENVIDEAENSTISLSQQNRCDEGSCRQDPIYWIANQ